MASSGLIRSLRRAFGSPSGLRCMIFGFGCHLGVVGSWICALFQMRTFMGRTFVGRTYMGRTYMVRTFVGRT